MIVWASGWNNSLLNPQEKKAKESGIQYVELDGDIGVIGNGAGLVMATIDLVAHFGGAPANFLDIGGGADEDRMRKSLDICLANPHVKGLFINIFGGITHCDTVAESLINYLDLHQVDIPLVVRMIGTNEDEAMLMLHNAGITMHESMEASAKDLIDKVKT